jgi:prepilin signal peptidase PulO-like enzyme (type II secretory pathway)
MAAIFSIILLITRTKKINENMAFGPFIVIASVITILVPFNTILNILVKICTLGLYKNK